MIGRFGTALAACGILLATAPVAAQAPGGHPPVAGWEGGAPGRPQATLLVEIGAGEGSVTVSQALLLAGGGSGPWTVPLLLPEAGPRPPLRMRVGEDDAGLLVRGRGGAEVRLEGGRIQVRGTPGPGGDFGAEVQYVLPVGSERLVLAATPSLDLARVQVIHKGGPHALQVRPLDPYRYAEEDEGDGTWCYQDLADPVEGGTPLRVAVGRLPSGSGPFRAAGLALLGVAAAGALLLLLRRRS